MSRSAAAGRARRSRAAQGAVLALLVGLLVVLAVRHDGAPVKDVELNDGGVWVANEELALTGRFNDQIDEFDMAVPTSATSDTIYQQGSSVQVFDDRAGGDGGTFFVLDVVTGQAQPVDLTGDRVAVAAGGTVGILDREDGRFWVRSVDDLDGFADGLPPTGEVAKNSQITASLAGTVLVADRTSGSVTAWALDERGIAVETDRHDLGRELLDDAGLTAVGETPVVLQNDLVLRPGEDPVPVSGAGPVLQQPGPEDDHVAVATTTGLWQVDLGGDEAEEVAGLAVDAPPAAPLVHAGCVYGAWADATTDNVVMRCDDGTEMQGRSTLDQTTDLVFRHNRDVVVLNNAANGAVDVVELSGLSRVDDWDSFDPSKPDPQQSTAEDVSTTKLNQPPRAVDDEYGARAGGTVVLPVTLNDEDPDGDLLVVSGLPRTGEGIDELTVVGRGTQVQAKVNANASGTVRFDYEITDGRPAHKPSEATVTVEIVPPETDTPPELDPERAPALEVVDGAEATVNVLPAWLDPEGDSVVLVAAEAREGGGEVAFRPDGTITYTDDGGGTGTEIIDYTVRGGADAAVAEGTLSVTVVDAADARPDAVADRFTGTVGSTIVLDPLANDSDPFGETLTLGRLGGLQGGSAQISQDSKTGLATFVAQAPRSYFVTYTATARNGVTSKPTPIRVDVVPPTENNRDPVAMRDIAVMRPGTSTLVDVLANDSDPDGDVLVVQGVEIPAQWRGRIKASLVNKQFIRVTADQTIKGERPELTYLLSDGVSNQVTGSVVLAESPDGLNNRPVAVEDVFTVRAGTVVTLPVRDNDRDPDGDVLTIAQNDLFDLGERKIVSDRLVPMVATGTGVRLLVPDDGTTEMQFGYGARDPSGARSDARVVLNILPDTPEGNRDPKPAPIQDRTVTGQPIRVAVDSYGADPDGDPVVFYGVERPPTLGRIVRSGAQFFVYEPFDGNDNTGTDVFTVRVKDGYGAEAEVEVRIGVAARTEFNQVPAALDDAVTVKPGLTIAYPVLDNDSDPDGDPLILDPDALEGDPSLDASVVEGGRVQITAPEVGDRPRATGVVSYTVTDGLGVESTALLAITASKDAPDHPPIANDDIADAAEVNGKVAGETVDVDVLANDGDIDGALEELVLSPIAGRTETVVDGKLRITLAPDGQIVPYQVTDRTDQASYGFVYVTGTEDLPPTLDPTKVPLEVVGGQRLDIDLVDTVIVRSGRTPKIVKKNDLFSSIGDVAATGDSSLQFRAARDYAGPAAVTLDVHDGEELNAPDTLISQITVPITVLPADNVPPVVRSANVEVLGGGEPVTLLLDRLATDANEDPLEFAVEGSWEGLRTELTDDLLVISADADTVSTVVPLQLEVSDGDADPVTGVVEVTVLGVEETGPEEQQEEVEPPRPPMTLQDLTLPDGVVGEPQSVSVAEAVLFDPYPGEAKTVESLSVDGPGRASGQGSGQITITPTGVGPITVIYTAGDGSGDPERAVTGRVTLTVAGLPGAPGKPSAVEGGPDSVQLKWRPPLDDGGADIAYYVVRWNDGSDSTRCEVTQCTISGLDAGEPYRFTVAAVNGISVDGQEEGPQSPPSDPVTPDTLPDVMAAPVVTSTFEDRDGKLALAWTEPDNEGSPIVRYEFQISRGSTGEVDKTAGASERSLVWAPLVNGEEYTFKVRAVNERGPTGNAGWSLPSAPQKPFTVPDQPAQPTLEADNGVAGSGGYLTASWQAATVDTNGGDDVTRHEVRLLRDGAVITTVPVDMPATTRVFDGVENGSSYAVQVRALNRAGWSEWSAASASKLSWDPATAPSDISKDSDCVGCSASTSSYRGRVRFTTPRDNGGFTVSQYRYRTTDGQTGTVAAPTTAEGATTTIDVPFRSSGANQQVTLTPVTTVDGQGEVAGTPGSGGDFDPYALPTTPSITSANGGYKQVGFAWNSGGGNGRSVAETQYEVQSPGSSGSAPGSGGSRTVATTQGGDQVCLRVRNRNAAGWSAWGGYRCASADPRVLEVTFTPTTRPSAAECSRPCYNVGWRIEGFRSNASYTAEWRSFGSSAAVCNRPAFGLGRNMTVGSDGRAARTETWYISSSCAPGGVVEVRIDGVVGARAVPSG